MLAVLTLAQLLSVLRIGTALSVEINAVADEEGASHTGQHRHGGFGYERRHSLFEMDVVCSLEWTNRISHEWDDLGKLGTRTS